MNPWVQFLEIFVAGVTPMLPPAWQTKVKLALALKAAGGAYAPGLVALTERMRQEHEDGVAFTDDEVKAFVAGIDANSAELQDLKARILSGAP